MITHPELVTLTLPDAFRPADELFGQGLAARIGDADAWLAQEAQRACSVDACKQKVTNWTTRRDSWAWAAGLGPAGGWGRVEARDTLMQAAVAAIYICNHRANGVTVLCEVSGVNGFDLGGLYSSAEAAHASARQQLARSADLPEGAYASEDFGRGAAASSEALRTQKLLDLTPLELPAGVRTVYTRDLLGLMKGGTAPTLVDVSGHATEALPGALTLWLGGVALDDAKAEEALDARLRKLLGLLAADKAAPVVFYGASRNHWHGVNAALRAQRAGWQNVMWYRGGLEAWRAAGLPTAPLLLRAVAR